MSTSSSLLSQLKLLVENNKTAQHHLSLDDAKRFALDCRKQVHHYAYCSAEIRNENDDHDDDKDEDHQQHLEIQQAANDEILKDATSALRLLCRTLVNEINEMEANNNNNKSTSNKINNEDEFDEPQPKNPLFSSSSSASGGRKTFALPTSHQHLRQNHSLHQKVPAAASGWRDSSSSSCASSSVKSTSQLSNSSPPSRIHNSRNNNNDNETTNALSSTPIKSNMNLQPSSSSSQMFANKDIHERKLALALAMNNLACALFAQKDFTGASVTLSQAAKLESEYSSSSSSATKQRHAAVTTLGNLIAIWNNKRNYEKAIEIGAEAMKLVDEMEFTHHQEKSKTSNQNQHEHLEVNSASSSSSSNSESEDDDDDEQNNTRKREKKNEKRRTNQSTAVVAQAAHSHSYPIAVVRYNFGAALLGYELNREVPSLFDQQHQQHEVIKLKTKVSSSPKAAAASKSPSSRKPIAKSNCRAVNTTKTSKISARDGKISEAIALVMSVDSSKISATANNYYSEFDQWGLNAKTRDALRHLRRARDDAIRIVKKAKSKREEKKSDVVGNGKTHLEKDSRLLIKNIDATVKELVANAEKIQEWREFYETTEKRLQEENELVCELDEDEKKMEEEFLKKLTTTDLTSPQKLIETKAPHKQKEARARAANTDNQSGRSRINNNKYDQQKQKQKTQARSPPRPPNATTFSDGLKLPPIALSPKYFLASPTQHQQPEMQQLSATERSKIQHQRHFRHHETARDWIKSISLEAKREERQNKIEELTKRVAAEVANGNDENAEAMRCELSLLQRRGVDGVGVGGGAENDDDEDDYADLWSSFDFHDDKKRSNDDTSSQMSSARSFVSASSSSCSSKKNGSKAQKGKGKRVFSKC